MMGQLPFSSVIAAELEPLRERYEVEEVRELYRKERVEALKKATKVLSLTKITEKASGKLKIDEARVGVAILKYGGRRLSVLTVAIPTDGNEILAYREYSPRLRSVTTEALLYKVEPESLKLMDRRVNGSSVNTLSYGECPPEPPCGYGCCNACAQWDLVCALGCCMPCRGVP